MRQTGNSSIFEVIRTEKPIQTGVSFQEAAMDRGYSGVTGWFRKFAHGWLIAGGP